MKSIAIVYHDADMDGRLSNEVCRYFLEREHPKASVHSYGWDYGRLLPTDEQRTHRITVEGGSANTTYRWSDYDVIYIVDLSVDELMARPELRDKIVWIDHHKSAIEKWDNRTGPISGNPVPNFEGIRIDGVAACRLCWAWFTWGKLPKGALPSKQDTIEPLTKSVFVDRRIKEPYLIRLAGEYDVWDHRDQNAKVLQFGLRTLSNAELRDLCEEEFIDALEPEITGCVPAVGEIIYHGRAIKAYCDKQNDEYSAAYSHTIMFEGLTFCALNIGQRGNSDLLKGGIKPEHDACFAWRYTGNDNMVMVSLYHIAGKEHHDLSKIAVKYGGGGHKGACGFRITLLELQEILD